MRSNWEEREKREMEADRWRMRSKVEEESEKEGENGCQEREGKERGRKSW